MTLIRELSRRGFLNMGAAAGVGMLLPTSFRPAFAAEPLAAVAEEDALIAFAYVGPTADEG